MTSTQTVKYLRDYAAPAHLVPQTELLFDIISETEVRITATLHIEPQHGATELELHGDATLHRIALNGETLPESRYTLSLSSV